MGQEIQLCVYHLSDYSRLSGPQRQQKVFIRSETLNLE